MRRRQMIDSRQIAEWCIIGMMAILVALMLLHLVATAIDRELIRGDAILDQQISPAQRAEVMSR